MDNVRPVQTAASEAGPEESAEEFAKKIDYEILEAALTEDELYSRCLEARALGLGAVVVRPCDVDSAGRFLNLGVVKVASVTGHPYGSSNTGVKVYECRDLLRRGVRQINAYPNPGKLLSRQFQHQEVELIQMADSCIEAGAILKVVVDNNLLNEEMKIILCRMAKRVNAHFVTTTKPRDLELLLKHCGHLVKLECGGVETLEQARNALASGCVRFSTATPGAILAEFEKKAARAETAT
jgi:deoxyribose-phosphate aldolase